MIGFSFHIGNNRNKQLIYTAVIGKMIEIQIVIHEDEIGGS